MSQSVRGLQIYGHHVWRWQGQPKIFTRSKEMYNMQHLSKIRRVEVSVLQHPTKSCQSSQKGLSSKNMTCANICGRYHAEKGWGKDRYASGQVYCKHCEAWLKWDGNHCPCCHYMVKKQASAHKYKLTKDHLRY